MRRALLRDLKNASEVKIMCAYFLPTSRLRRALRGVVKRGGKVQLILAGKSDVGISQLATRRLYEPLLRGGVEIFEYQPQVLHAKMFIIDDLVYVGSANLDVRSLKINHELLVRLSERKAAVEALSLFGKDLQQSKPIERDEWRRSRGIFSKLKERWAYLVLARLDPYLARVQLRRR